jgi:anti-sigma regulatory factor (Ser/Thr protein kinase)
VRADLTEIAGTCPVIDELVLLASELAANAVTHSRSGHPGGMFTVRATLYPGDYAWVEVIDQGGPWLAIGDNDEHGRGLAVVAMITGDGNWGIEGDESARVAWFRLDWPRP